MLDPHALHIFTDGSCFKNPGGLSGCAAIVRYPDECRPEEQIVGEGVAESTIGRMELMAVNQALEWLIENTAALPVTRVQIITDSRYVYESTSRVTSWRANGWCAHSGRPIENRDLWKKFLSLRSKVRIRLTFHWVKGKKSPILKRVDKAARSAAQDGALGVDRGFKPGKVGRSKGKIGGAAVLFPARGDNHIVSIYRSDIVGKSENKIRFVLFCEEKQDFIGKYYAYAKPELGAELHRGHSYKVKIGNTPEYPIIEELLEEVTLLPASKPDEEQE